MTIEGGPGWQLDDAPGDTIGGDDRAERAPSPVSRLAAGLAARVPVAIALAAAVGFGAATLLADVRTDTLGESDAGTLSLEVRVTEDWGDGRLSRGTDGGLVRALSVYVRNTGPREIALEGVWLEGTDWRSEDATGRRVAARRSAYVVLVRPVDCDRLPEESPEGPGPAPTAVVRAVTDAGVREQRVPAAADGWVLSSEPDRRSCGVVPPDEAVQAGVFETRSFPAGADLDAQLGNVSRYVVEVTGVQAPPGVQVQVLDESGSTPLPLPLRLAGVDVPGPRSPFAEVQYPSLEVTLRVTIADCALLAPTRSILDRGQAQIALEVESELGAGTTHLHDAEGIVTRLREEGC